MASKSLRNKLGAAVVTIIVGTPPEQEIFTVHEALLSSCSKFFRNAMNGKWRESEDRKIELLDDDPEVFELYLQACYAGNVTVDDNANVSERYSLWAQVYVMGETFMDVDAKDIVVRAMFAEGDHIWSLHFQDIAEATRTIYTSIGHACNLRKLLVDRAVYSFKLPGDDWAGWKAMEKEEVKQEKKAYRTFLAEAPREFLEDLTLRLLQERHLPEREEQADDYHWGMMRHVPICLLEEDYLEQKEPNLGSETGQSV